jgi:hypothetical protein
MNAEGAQVCEVCEGEIVMQGKNQPAIRLPAAEASAVIMSSVEVSSHAQSLDALFPHPHFQDEIVKLNVGGETFITSKSTLVGINGDRQNYFALLFSQDKAALQDEHGAFFIDRDPAYFKCILQYLRTGLLIMTKNLLPALLHLEFKFYSLNFPTREKFPPTFDLNFVAKHFAFIEQQSPHGPLVTLKIKKEKCSCCRNGIEIKMEQVKMERSEDFFRVSVTTPVSTIVTVDTLDTVSTVLSKATPPVVVLDSNIEIKEIARFLNPALNPLPVYADADGTLSYPEVIASFRLLLVSRVIITEQLHFFNYQLLLSHFVSIIVITR